MNIVKRKEKLISKLKNKKYREAFVAELITTGIPFQIKALREQEQRKWTQKDLGDRCGIAQETISRLEDPNYGKLNLGTLKRLASAFDVALMVRFVPFSELVEWELNLSPKSLEILSFEQESYFKDKLEVDISAVSTEQDQMAIVSKYTMEQLSDALKDAVTKTATAGNPYYVDSGRKLAA